MSSSSQRPLINAAYYPSWRIYRGLSPSSLQLDCINRVLYAFVLVNEDGTLRFLDEHADFSIAADGERGCLAALTKLKQHHHGIQVLVSIGGGSGSAEFPVLASHPSRRATFARACRQLVDRFLLDGIDIDWEHPQTPYDGGNYLQLLRALREALPAPRYVLTTALPVGEYALRNIDLGAAAALLDNIHLMGYDFHGPWTDVCGHHAKLLPEGGGAKDEKNVYPTLRHSCHRGVRYVTSRGFPADKIVLGVPAYARSFAGAHGVGQPFRGAEEIDYAELPEEWIRGAKIDRDVVAASYVDRHGHSSNQHHNHNHNLSHNHQDGGKKEKDKKGFVTFDVPETVRAKAEYVRCMGLGGLFFWTGAGDRKGPDSLVRAGFEALRSGDPAWRDRIAMVVAGGKPSPSLKKLVSSWIRH
ncbi:glycoside hydrolase family 18 protein [Biscogniauxia marginata]|nr:glycoside hydrolase family 18 protein [Biscogniauxia marginata]